MTQTRAPTKARAAAVEPAQQVRRPQARSAQAHLAHKRHLSPFWRHFLEMLAAMAVGMIATGAIFISVTGLKTWDEVTVQYPNQVLLGMAAGMSLPMVAWMLYRGMGRRNAYEMAAAMVLPVLPFLGLVWFHIGKGAQCGAYCALTIVAMLVLMRYRRSAYAMPM
jgi:flagellar biosynthetic protein FliP